MNTDIQRKIKDSIRLLYQCSLLLLITFLIAGSLYAGCDPLDGNIAENVTVGGIHIGGMSMESAEGFEEDEPAVEPEEVIEDEE